MPPLAIVRFKAPFSAVFYAVVSDHHQILELTIADYNIANLCYHISTNNLLSNHIVSHASVFKSVLYDSLNYCSCEDFVRDYKRIVMNMTNFPGPNQKSGSLNCTIQ